MTTLSIAPSARQIVAEKADNGSRDPQRGRHHLEQVRGVEYNVQRVQNTDARKSGWLMVSTVCSPSQFMLNGNFILGSG